MTDLCNEQYSIFVEIIGGGGGGGGGTAPRAPPIPTALGGGAFGGKHMRSNSGIELHVLVYVLIFKYIKNFVFRYLCIN